MKRNILTAVLLLFLSHGTLAQWKWVHPQPCGNMVLTIKAVDSLHVWFSGTGGTILSTKDGGRTWETYQCSSNDQIVSTSFTDTLKGWMSGLNGVLLRTIDGGKNWSRNVVGNTSYGDICYVDSLHGWLGSYLDLDTMLYHSDNGGINWEPASTRISSGSGKIAFADALHGWIGGSASLLSHTSDGGMTFQSQNLGLPSEVGVLCFPDTSNGYIMLPSWDSKIRYTRDAGETWKSVDMPFFDPNNLYFCDKNHGWVVGNISRSAPVYSNGRIARTTDGGISYFNIYSLMDRSFMRGITASDSLHAWAAGDGGMIFGTTDGGVHWEKKSLSFGDPVMINDVFALKNEHKAWAVGYGGFILKTEDNGKTWVKQNCGSDLILTSVYFFDANNGIIVGEASRIYRTSDGGANWATVTTPVLGNFTKVCFSTPTHGWVTASRTIIETRDGGATWDSCFLLNDDIDLLSISFSDSLHGWAIGSALNGQVFYSMMVKTRDGGKTWTTKEFPTPQLNSICFTDSLHGWICGENGNILRTTDGGNNFSQIVYNRYDDFFSVHFTDSLHGWVVGDGSLWPYFGGIALYTEDGGRSWVRKDNGVGISMHSVFFTDPGFGYIAGDDGAILRWGENPMGITDPKPLEPKMESGNYPNPFEDKTKIWYILPGNENASITVYNIFGRIVKLIQLNTHNTGYNTLEFNRDQLPSGIYFCRIQQGKDTKTIKLLVRD